MSTQHDSALVFSPHWSPRIAREIRINFPDRSRVFTTSKEELLDRLPKYPQWVEDFLAWKHKYPVEYYEELIQQEGLHAVTWDNEHYPKLLKEIHNAPLVLFVEGNIPQKESWCAVIGSREATAYGKTHARFFAHELTKHNIGVVSGLAYGIDEQAIRGACNTQSAVIAVLAGGHTCMNNREKEIKDLIITNGGAVISEHTPRTQPQAYFFPIRNRIIAGIAERTLVIEAKLKSGSLITAQKALEENRDVFAVPGLITSATSKGCHKLLRDGATPCTSIYDILNIPEPEDYQIPTAQKNTSHPSPHRTTPYPQSPSQHPTPHPLPPSPTPLHTKLWEYLQLPRTFDSLVEYAQEKGAEVAGILNIWEIEGYLAIKNGLYSLVPYEHSPHC